jgi:hypothetical protein
MAIPESGTNIGVDSSDYFRSFSGETIKGTRIDIKTHNNCVVSLIHYRRICHFYLV